MTPAPHIKGWCPGALRPMTSGDGMIVRLRVTGGTLSIAQLRSIAHAATSYGNGLIDLTARGNMQLRGVSETTWPQLIESLSQYGLIDPSSAAESVRNVMASPLAGIDPTALIDITPLTRALEQHLVATDELHELPGKFGFLIDDGGAIPIKNFPADVAFEATGDHACPVFALRLGGSDHVALVPPADLVASAHKAALHFITHRRQTSQPFKRMKDLVAARGVATILKALGFDTPLHRPRPHEAPSPIGAHRSGSQLYFGVASPLGRWTAATLLNLADVADRHLCRSLRLTPWRAILLPDLDDDGVIDCMTTFGSQLIVKADDPRLGLVACTGAPSCIHATVETQNVALSFASIIPAASLSKNRLHVSGCEKGCAHPRPSTVTLTGRDGRFDLVIKGVASDAPKYRDLDLATARGLVAEIFAREAL